MKIFIDSDAILDFLLLRKPYFRDVSKLLLSSKENNIKLSLIDSVIESNSKRKIKMAKKIGDVFFGQIKDKKIALLGLAFKANTDDIRYSPAIAIAKELLKGGAKIMAHDFEAIKNAKEELKEFADIEFFDDIYSAISGADLIVVATEWMEYKNLDLNKVKTLTHCRQIVDLRNVFVCRDVVDAGFDYYYIGGSALRVA